MQTTSHHRIEELQVLRRKAQGGLRDRLQMVILAMEGRTAPEIAAALGSSRRTVQDWVYRYNASGVKGLIDRRGGNHRRLTFAQEQRVCEYLDRTAADPHQGIRRGEDLRRWIDRQFGVVYTLTGIYELLHRLGYSCLMPRPRHAQSDPQAQEEFKKKRLAKWSRSPASTRANASRSGSRMKPVSDSRGR
jgi:transposase